MEELWQFNVHVGPSRIPLRGRCSLSDVCDISGCESPYVQTKTGRILPGRQEAPRSRSHRRGDPNDPANRPNVTAFLLAVSRGSQKRGLGGKVSVTVWEFPSGRPNLLISASARGSEQCG